MQDMKAVKVLAVRSWEDVVVDRVGFPASGPYLEAVWLGIIGPSAAWTLRRLVVQLSAQSSGYDLVVTDLAADLGLGKGSGHNSRVMASVTRLVLFGLARWSGPEELQVRQFLPPVTNPRLIRLSPRAQRAHARAMASRSPRAQAR